MMPPRKAISLPERMGACTSASALVRVKRGSTWMMSAPRRLASTTKRKAIGWFSAMLEPMTTMQSLFSRSHSDIVAAPRPKEVPRLGTEDECQMRAWFSTLTIPNPPLNSFLIR